MARTLRLATLGITLLALVAVCWKPLTQPLPLIVWNASDSILTGLYWVEKRAPDIDEIAVLKPPAWAAAIADQRGYLPKNAWLLKPVAASKGIICRFGDAVFVDGQVVTKALKHDKSGRALPVWTGCKSLRENEVFVISKHRDSFDSRYFGPVSTSMIIGTAEPLILLGK